MSHGSLTRALVLLIALPVSLAAQSVAPRIDPTVQTVVSGGRWNSGATVGSFRVVEVAEGMENVRYRVFVQWVEVAEEGVRVKRSRELGPLVPGQFSLTKPQLVYRDKLWQVDVLGASEPMEQAHRPITFIIGQPGQVTLVKSH